MVFIHPTIISNPSIGHVVSQSKYTYLQDQQDQLTEMKKLEIEPDLAEFPDPPELSEEEPDSPDSESDPNPESGGESQ
jgi:hypothetical protein